MNQRPNTASDYPGSSRAVCPKCQGHMSRVKRRFIDHLLSMFMPVQRYRCRIFSCQWEGNLRVCARDREEQA